MPEPRREETQQKLTRLGLAVRQRRSELGLTLRGLADQSGVSERFLSDLERGVGNISMARLIDVAQALETRLSELVAALDEVPRGNKSIVLVGLRGAGKSTIGAALAQRLGWPLVEIDAEVELRAGISLNQLFELYGESYYRKIERSVVEELIASDSPKVIAAGGGIVNDAETWQRLGRAARRIWLSAAPETHYRRVEAQGDLRPMKDRPDAMAELTRLLASRAPKYAESELILDTEALGIEGSAKRIVEWLGRDEMPMRTS